MKKYIFLISFFLMVSFLVGQAGELHFNKGITYYLLDDIAMAKKQMELYFLNRSEFQLRNGFMRLLQGKSWDATSEFRAYLGINHRSQIALVGIALSTVEMKNTATIENLERAIRLNPRISSPYICLGFEYMKKKNYPRAEFYFNRVLKFSHVPEFKILLAKLYLMTSRPKLALNLMKPEADKKVDNFYFNFLTAQAYYKLNSLESIGQYIELALESKPQSSEAKLLKAKYLMARGNYKDAKAILINLKFDHYNDDYTKTLARVLLELKDRRALNQLYKFFSKNKWDKDINRLMGQYFLKLQDKFNVQNWIYRSILSGNDTEKLKQLFPDKFQFPEYPNLSFFEVKRIKWISDTLLLAVAIVKSGDPEKIYIIDIEKMKVLNTLKYQGVIQEIFTSTDLSRIIFSTIAAENERIYLYAIEKIGSRFVFKAAYRHSINIPSALVGFNQDGTLAYITDAQIASLAFESPFSNVSLYDQKRLIYPVFPFPIYCYHFETSRFSQIQNTNQVEVLENIPIREIQRYAFISRAFQANSQINKLIQRGQKLDLTSSQVIKIHFSDDPSVFIIYLSDLNNAFQALIYDDRNNRVTRVDATMFLGKERYAEVEILAFHPEKNEILLKTKDKQKNLIEFNYRSYLYSDLTKNVNDFCFNTQLNLTVALTERSNNIHYSDTYLELIFRNPFVREIITTRRDLNKVTCCEDSNRICFTTYNGERLHMDDQYRFHYRGVSLEDAPHDISPTARKAAVFVNGRLLIMDWTR